MRKNRFLIAFLLVTFILISSAYALPETSEQSVVDEARRFLIEVVGIDVNAYKVRSELQVWPLSVSVMLYGGRNYAMLDMELFDSNDVKVAGLQMEFLDGKPLSCGLGLEGVVLKHNLKSDVFAGNYTLKADFEYARQVISRYLNFINAPQYNELVGLVDECERLFRRGQVKERIIAPGSELEYVQPYLEARSENFWLEIQLPHSVKRPIGWDDEFRHVLYEIEFFSKVNFIWDFMKYDAEVSNIFLLIDHLSDGQCYLSSMMDTFSHVKTVEMKVSKEEAVQKAWDILKFSDKYRNFTNQHKVKVVSYKAELELKQAWVKSVVKLPFEEAEILGNETFEFEGPDRYTLRPVWNVNFAFDNLVIEEKNGQPFYRWKGFSVQIRADTGEATEVGFFGESIYPETSLPPGMGVSEEGWEPLPPKSNTLNPIWLIAAIIIATTTTVTAIAIRRKRKNTLFSNFHAYFIKKL